MQFSLDGKDTIDIDTACLVGANLYLSGFDAGA